MGLSNFPSPVEGVIPTLVMNTVMSVAMLKNVLRSVLRVVVGGGENPSNEVLYSPVSAEHARERESRVSVILFKSLYNNHRSSAIPIIRGSSDGGGTSSGWSSTECCVCLYGFEADEEVSELPCKHFFHKNCLKKWFDHKHNNCPLCRSTL